MTYCTNAFKLTKNQIKTGTYPNLVTIQKEDLFDTKQNRYYFINDKQCCQGQVVVPLDKVAKVSNLKWAKFQGRGKYLFFPKLYVGEFKNDKLDGQGAMWNYVGPIQNVEDLDLDSIMGENSDLKTLGFEFLYAGVWVSDKCMTDVDGKVVFHEIAVE